MRSFLKRVSQWDVWEVGHVAILKVPCSYEVSYIGKFALRMCEREF